MAARGLILALAVLLVFACSDVAKPRGTPVTYRNDTTESLTLTNDELLLTILAPRQSKAITTREDLLPDRIRAFTERNELIFDQTFTWADLQANNFVVVISRTVTP
jgi:hypothetical protein